ncbi:hypothetical protein A3SI_10059 [Nitritalea halalkaliphila LW7]|uniref:Outer membrane protein beta-barrel domain-containing protein n=1 Tax=Nitritalea halalkaliphila LW7 TaxID=1189621 RepID=I5C3H2_9BACT|nr:hypothetical protein [Nitritalea halalkaliphila]EIM76374.1 hypothetical protein A3SI_10059 [Nitritalea halalkaliphila LW7]
MFRFSKFLLPLLLFILGSQAVVAQVYLGGTYVNSEFGPSGLQVHNGFGALVQRQFYLQESRFSLTPTLQGNLLNSRQDRELAELHMTISLATHINYDIVATPRFRLTPFVGPAFVYASGLRAQDLFFNETAINFTRIALETGFSFTYVHSDRFSIKCYPLTYMWGNSEFRQGNVATFIFQLP